MICEDSYRPSWGLDNSYESHFGDGVAGGYEWAIPCQQVNVMGSYTETI
jgi:hypothetical protein